VPKGCRFAEARCHELDPELTILADGRAVACLLAADGTLPAEVPP
jgi:peptide/nickel transport system ATP-binding protein/oligopeptide transport system ATP-binding protein